MVNEGRPSCPTTNARPITPFIPCAGFISGSVIEAIHIPDEIIHIDVDGKFDCDFWDFS
jgi:hypothetical protein